MDFMQIMIALVVAGVLLWVVNTYLPLDAKIRRILNIVAVLIIVLWLCREFGLFDYLKGVKP